MPAVSDFNTMSDHLHDLLEERAKLYEKIDSLRKKLKHCAFRSQGFWLFSGDASTELMTVREHDIIVKRLEDQCSYWREVALCSTAEVKSSTYDD